MDGKSREQDSAAETAEAEEKEREYRGERDNGGFVYGCFSLFCKSAKRREEKRGRREAGGVKRRNPCEASESIGIRNRNFHPKIKISQSSIRNYNIKL